MFPQIYAAEFMMILIATTCVSMTVIGYVGLRILGNTSVLIRGVILACILMSLGMTVYALSETAEQYQGFVGYGAYAIIYTSMVYVYLKLRTTPLRFPLYELAIMCLLMIATFSSGLVFTYLQKNMLTATVHSLLSISVVCSVYFFLVRLGIRVLYEKKPIQEVPFPKYIHILLLIFVLVTTAITTNVRAYVMAEAFPDRSLDEITILIPERDESLTYAGIFLADELDVYKKKGVQVSFEVYPEDALIDGVADGYGSFAVVSDVSLVRARQEGRAVVAVASVFQRPPEPVSAFTGREVIITRSDVIETYPDILQRFISGTQDGWTWLFSNEGTGLHLLIERLFSGASYNVREKTRQNLSEILHLATPTVRSTFGCHDAGAWRDAFTEVYGTSTEATTVEPQAAYTELFLTCP